MFYTTELLLSKYLKASQACGTPPVTSKSNNSDKVTAQWLNSLMHFDKLLLTCDKLYSLRMEKMNNAN